MKSFIFALIAVSTFSLGAHASRSAAQPKTKTITQKVCEALETKIEDDCSHIMCDDAIADGTFENMDECVGGEDYAEAAQGACDDQPTLEDLVNQYNQKHSKTKIKCD